MNFLNQRCLSNKYLLGYLHFGIQENVDLLNIFLLFIFKLWISLFIFNFNILLWYKAFAIIITFIRFNKLTSAKYSLLHMKKKKDQNLIIKLKRYKVFKSFKVLKSSKINFHFYIDKWNKQILIKIYKKEIVRIVYY